MRREQTALSLAMVGLLVVTACAPSPSAGGGAEPAAPAPEREKTLTAMIQREPGSFDQSFTAMGSSRSGGVNHVYPIVRAEISRVDEAGQRQPGLATEIPTQAKGTVVMNPDGTMDVTWKLRPDIYWHDDTPVTTGDFLFRHKVNQELQIVGNLPPGFLKSVTALDPKTMVVRWSVPYVRYDEANVEKLPQHILGDLYDRDKDALILSRYFRGEHVGTGPFKLVEWVEGSHMEFRRNERYHLGVPPIHRLFLRFVPDINTMVANLLAGVVDVALPEGIDMEKAIELRKRWQEEGTGHQVKSYITPAVYQLEIMVNPEFARPISALPVTAVRQGLYHAIDRPALNQALHGDLGMVADSFYAPNDKYYPMVKDVIPQYPYDPRRARQLFEQSGWTVGPDGVYVHPPSGPRPSGPTSSFPYDLPATGEERFDIHLMLFPGQQHFKLGSIVQANWKDVGVNTRLESLTPANQTDVSYTSRRTGLFTSNPGGSAFYTGRLLCSSIPTEAKRWSGSNRGHFCDPTVDDLLTKITYTIPPAEQQVLHRALLAETIGKAMLFPLYWESVPIIMLKGVTGPNMLGSVTTMDIHKWDKE
ncbi:MAG: hypothetical protein HY534_03805 [Chloroflexi bacterium]|nr:hypothetical protein [Chloroflexota bacterium]